MYTGFHFLRETSIGQMLARWIGNCFQLMEMPFVTEWGDLKSNPLSWGGKSSKQTFNVLVGEMLRVWL